jgi:hypothetical protein
MTINSTAATNSFHGISISTTDNSASIANNVFAVYADATLGTNGSATRWAGYFLGRGYFSGNVGIGTTSPTARLDVVRTGATPAYLSGTSAAISGVYSPTTLNANYHYGVQAQLNYTNLTVTGQYSSAGVYANTAIASSQVTNPSGHYLSAIFVQNIISGSSPSVDRYAGVDILLNDATGTISNYYGVIIRRINSASTITNHWGIYQEAGAKNYFSGNTLIGTTTDAGQRLQIEGGAATAIRTNNSGTNPGLQIRNSSISYIHLDISGVVGRSFGIFNSSGDIAIQQALGWSGANYHIFYGAGGYATNGSGTFGDNVPANASAVLEAKSTTKGFLPPRMTGAQAELIGTPAAGLLVYANNGNGATITSTGWWGYNGTTWVKLN